MAEFYEIAYLEKRENDFLVLHRNEIQKITSPQILHNSIYFKTNPNRIKAIYKESNEKKVSEWEIDNLAAKLILSTNHKSGVYKSFQDAFIINHSKTWGLNPVYKNELKIITKDYNPFFKKQNRIGFLVDFEK